MELLQSHRRTDTLVADGVVRSRGSNSGAAMLEDLPQSPSSRLFASALWSALVSAISAVLMVMVSTVVDRNYGWTPFVFLPFLMGIPAALLSGRGTRPTLSQSLPYRSWSSV